ncbi:MAG: hypothetical protein RR504_03220 [Christensenellaceae bacterium]
MNVERLDESSTTNVIMKVLGSKEYSKPKTLEVDVKAELAKVYDIDEKHLIIAVY